MVCSRCKKRPAVVFITRMEGEKTVNDGLCLVCAKELGIKPVNDMLEKFGMTNVVFQIYPGSRHELLCDLNKEQVTGH